MTERELFAAYRTLDGWEAPCSCGDTIRALHGDEATVAGAVALHNESTVHTQWASWQEAVIALRRPTRRRCPCGGHGFGDNSLEGTVATPDNGGAKSPPSEVAP